MAIAKVDEKQVSEKQKLTRKILVICPICKQERILDVPASIINQAKQLTTVSIPKGAVCNHLFQAFVDKNFKVRGYQKVDFEFETQQKRKDPNFIEEIRDNDNNLFDNLIMEGNFLEYRPKKKPIQTNYNEKHLENLLLLRKEGKQQKDNNYTNPPVKKTNVTKSPIKEVKKESKFTNAWNKLSNSSKKQSTKKQLNRTNPKEIPKEEKVNRLKEIYEEFWEFIDDDSEEFKEYIKNDKRRKQTSRELDFSF